MNDVNELIKINKSLERKLKEAQSLVSSYEQYSVFQKNLYESLKKQKDAQEKYLHLVFNNTPDIIGVIDTDMTYVHGTKNTLAQFGFNTDALTGRNFAEIAAQVMPADWIADVGQCISEVQTTGVEQKLSKTAFMLGKIMSHDIHIIPFSGDDGKIGGAILMIHDTTELHEQVLAAQSSNRAKTNFLAKISHEIRTPMNAIAGMSELILREDTSSLVREHALSIKQASANLMAIINDVLDFSKIESGKLEIVETEYEFRSLYRDVIRIIRARVIDKPIFFTANADGGIPKNLIGDEIRIRQILLNLLSNALKYCDRGFISIHARLQNLNEREGVATIVFEVADSGIGIRQEEQEKLFRDFAQLDRVTNKGVEGTGLGLVISKNLCEAMGGSISVKSEYGKGSTFTVNIPQKFLSYEKYAEVENANKIKILIYETRHTYANSVVQSAETLGVSHTLVTTQNEFLDKLNKKNYSHVFVSSFLAGSAEEIIKNFCANATIVMLAEYGDNIVENESAKVLEMPAQTATVADILNNAAENSDAETEQSGGHFIAPTARILIVDDVITNLRVAEGLMLPYQMQIDVCRSGREAIDLTVAKEYDIIFMDHMMPEMDGVEAVNIIRALDGERFKNVPVIALTANAVTGVKEMFLRNGFNDFLAKPIDLVKLSHVLETWLPKEKMEASVERVIKEEPCAIKIRGIDTNAGVFLTGGNFSNYLRVLSAFLHDSQNIMTQLRDASQKGNLKRYAASAHAAKGALASIGAAKLSSLIKALELAAKSNDIEYVKINNELFLEELETLIKNIADALAAQEKNKSSAPHDETQNSQIQKYFAELKSAITALDIETADALLTKLQSEKSSWPEASKRTLEEVAHKILVSEYDEALRVLEGVV